MGRDAAMGVAGDYDPVTGRFGFVGANGWQGAAMGTREAATAITSALESKYGLAEGSFSYTNVAKARGIARTTGRRFDDILESMAGASAAPSRVTSRSEDYFSKAEQDRRAASTKAAIAEQERQEREAEAA